jgi:hypothetical protein
MVSLFVQTSAKYLVTLCCTALCDIYVKPTDLVGQFVAQKLMLSAALSVTKFINSIAMILVTQ